MSNENTQRSQLNLEEYPEFFPNNIRTGTSYIQFQQPISLLCNGIPCPNVIIVKHDNTRLYDKFTGGGVSYVIDEKYEKIIFTTKPSEKSILVFKSAVDMNNFLAKKKGETIVVGTVPIQQYEPATNGFVTLA